MTVQQLGEKLMELPGDLEVIAYVDWSGPIRSVYVETGRDGTQRVILDES